MAVLLYFGSCPASGNGSGGQAETGAKANAEAKRHLENYIVQETKNKPVIL